MKFKDIIFKIVQKRHVRTPRYQSYASAKTILLLFESDMQERNVQIKALIKQLQADGKEVNAWGYVRKKEAESSVLRDYRVLSERDYTFLGMPQDTIRQEIANRRYDILIDLNMNNLLPLKYLSLYAEADFRAGRQTEQPYMNDFMIDVKAESNPAFLFDQIIHYLKTIETC